MSATVLDLQRLERARQVGDKTVTRCLACAEAGHDRAGNHLAIYPSGALVCIKFPGDTTHNRRNFELLGQLSTVASCREKHPQPRRGSPALPADLRKPTVSELVKIQHQRNLPAFAGLELAARARHLFVSDSMHDGNHVVPAWIITDSTRRSAQARRMDGRLWAGINAKAKTVRGSEASWPIGIVDVGSKGMIALNEGGPDFLTAWFLAWWHGRQETVAPVCMLGAGQRIHPDALPLFVDKRVMILPHKDSAGVRAESIWRSQLEEIGVGVGSFDVGAHKDLNDLVAACVLDDEEAA